MSKVLLLLAAGLVAGLAGVFWLTSDPAPATAVSSGSTVAVDGGPTGSAGATAARVAELEAALKAEVAQRRALEERVGALGDEVAALHERPPAETGAGADPSGDTPANGPPGPPRFARNFAARRGDPQARELDRLIDAGFAPDRAEWIAQRTAELRMKALQEQYDAAREGRPPDQGPGLAGDSTLRAELGDSDYERYLTALGRPTSVPVQSVLASSPAERSGLKSGDEVVAYDGKRVFDMRELNQMTLEGTAGESVTVSVRRDGQTIQLTMPRGPLGIFGGGFRGR
jgi:membrane-associated protease RseP (regulator of RpoE activity)